LIQFFNKLEKKYGRYAISNLMYYIVFINIIGAVIGVINPQIYSLWLSLDFDRIFHGQVWRLFTFILEPAVSSPTDVFWFAINQYLYYMIGNALERAWGAFRFNMYYLSGVLLTILGCLVLYLAWGVPSIGIGLGYVYQAMFLAFAVLYPDMQLMLFFILPIKVKWLGIIYGAMIAVQVISCLTAGAFAYAFCILIAMGNFLLFFLLSRNYRRISPKEVRRRQAFKKEIKKETLYPGGTRHRCAICGRTEKDDPGLEFRFCSRCDGNYEYCMEHIFSHKHIHKEDSVPNNVRDFHR